VHVADELGPPRVRHFPHGTHLRHTRGRARRRRLCGRNACARRRDSTSLRRFARYPRHRSSRQRRPWTLLLQGTRAMLRQKPAAETNHPNAWRIDCATRGQRYCFLAPLCGRCRLRKETVCHHVARESAQPAAARQPHRGRRRDRVRPLDHVKRPVRARSVRHVRRPVRAKRQASRPAPAQRPDRGSRKARARQRLRGSQQAPARPARHPAPRLRSGQAGIRASPVQRPPRPRHPGAR
jgi:hypothetical protein